MEQLVSIIVPVYNTGEYLAPCLESLITQTYNNIEIILVDDGSTDGSGAVCDEFANKDDRITVIHQGNGGVSAARNAGLTQVAGAYLTFVDADDRLVPQAVETAMDYLLKNDADMVTYGWQKQFSDDGHTENQCAPFEASCDRPMVIREVLMNYSAYGGGYPWNKLWRISAFSNQLPRFAPDLYYFEDLEWVIRMLLRVRKIVVCPECLYLYRIHSNSVSNTPVKAERRELGYHHSVEQIIEDLTALPELQSWFFQKYAPEIVNGILFSIKNRYSQLRSYLLERMQAQRMLLLHSESVGPNIKIRCRILLALLGLRLL